VIFPTNEQARDEVVAYLAGRCLSTRDERERLYLWREKYYLFGTTSFEQAKYNKLAAHLDLVSSFLFSPDHAFYHIAADRNASDIEVQQAISLQDDFNEDFQSNIAEYMSECVKWALVYDTMIPKVGWNRDRGHFFVELIPPHNFGVYRETIADLDSQECFAHTYFIDYQKACGKLMLAGKEDWINRLKITFTDTMSAFPQMMQRMIISGTGGTNLAGTIFGQMNPDYLQSPIYQAKTEVPLVRFTELWSWDDSCSDWRCFQMLEPDLVIYDSKQEIEAYKKATRNVEYLFGRLKKMGKDTSDCNPFFPEEHPFEAVRPYQKYNYFWGQAHIDSLIYLQEWYLERLDQISDILESQADPPRVGSGFLGLNEEKIQAFGAAGTYLFDQLPQAKMETFAPEMPADLFAEVKEISNLFLEASGLTEVMAGRSEQGVRSRQHASELKKSGSGRIKKAALAIEGPIVRLGDKALKLKMAHDPKELKAGPDENDQVHKFLACDVKDVRMRVDGHSHSPLFGEEAETMAVLLKKSQAIDNEDFIRMLNPPSRDNLLHHLAKRERKQKQMMQQLQQKDPAAFDKMLAGGAHGSHHKK
jgi:hypothetical protein